MMSSHTSKGVSPIPQPITLTTLKALWDKGFTTPEILSNAEKEFRSNCVVNLMEIYRTFLHKFLETKEKSVEIRFDLNPDYYSKEYPEELVIKTIMAGVRDLFPECAVKCTPVTTSSWMNGIYIDYYKISAAFSDS